MGATNILSGKVVATGDGKLQLETDSGLRVIALYDEDTGSNEITGISVHPELIELLPLDAGLEGDNRFRGRTIEMIYQGDFIETKISLSQTGELLTAHFPSRLEMVTRLSPGEEVLVHWSPKSSNTLLDQ